MRPGFAALGILVCCVLSSCTGGGDGDAGGGDGAKSTVIAMLPKLVNIDYFDACERGAKKAAAELGVTLIYDGPKKADGAEQNKFIQGWIRQRVDAICVAPNQPKAVVRYIKEAQAAGIKVLTWDTDSKDSGRDLMVNQVDDEVLGNKLMDELARQMGEEGQWAISIGSLTASNLNAWRVVAEARAKAKYPKLQLVATEVTDENEILATQKAEQLLNKYPELKGILAFDSNSVPGAAAAVKNLGRVGKVAVVGNSTPNKMRRFLDEGVVECFFLWDPTALGSLAVHCAKLLVDGTAVVDGVEVRGHGKLTFSPVDPKMVILSDPIRFTKENIDQYDFGI